MIHFLFTWEYETFGVQTSLGIEGYKRNLLVYHAALICQIEELESIAKERAEVWWKHCHSLKSRRLPKRYLPKLNDTDVWFSNHVEERAMASFEADEALFASDGHLIGIIGNCVCH